jgi:hypothetical protein
MQVEQKQAKAKNWLAIKTAIVGLSDDRVDDCQLIIMNS